MSSYFTRGAGRNVGSLFSSSDEHQDIIPSRHERQHRRRKSLKVKPREMRQRVCNAVSDESTDEVAAANGEDDGSMGDSEESEDATEMVFAPSGATTKSAMLKMKSNRRSIGNRRQAGLVSTTTPSKVVKPRGILSHTRTRSSDKVRFNLENIQTIVHEPLHEGAEPDDEAGDVDLSSESDDEVYETLNFLSDSDEDDEKIEELESEFLIRHLEETGEINEINTADTFSTEYDLTQSASIKEEPESDFAVDFFSQNGVDDVSIYGGSQSIPDIVSSIELASEPFPSFQHTSFSTDDLSRVEFETGLQTPSSIQLPSKKFDDEETDEEEPSKRRGVCVARLSRNLSQNPAVPNRVRKNSKPKTPKRGSWNIPTMSTLITHDDKGELIMTQKGKGIASGTVTPRGVVSRDSVPSTPIIGIPMAQFASSIVTSPVLATTPHLGQDDQPFFSDFQPASPTFDLRDYVLVKDDHE